MKIDIHAHTKKCKSGDAPTRDISPSDFREAVLSTDVRIIALTNHNVFDLDQYKQIENSVGKDVQVWPGIELDIKEDATKGHLLVIVSPARAGEFSETVKELTRASTPDSFAATVEEVLQAFEPLGPLYVAHYRQKKPNLSDAAVEKLLAGAKNPGCVIKEVANSISAGIYISHGHASIYGSDVQDWADYGTLSLELPDLRLPVDSFEHFCLLLEKDPTTINTALNRKTSEELVLYPFDDGIPLKLQAFDDINVIFGPKGTGKSCILHAIAKHYAESGIEASVYEPASDRLNEIFDTKGKALTINLDTHGINYCSDEIEFVRNASEVGVTSINKYVAYFTSKTTNKNAKKLLFKDLEPEEEVTAKRDFLEFNDAVATTATFLEFLAEDPSVTKELSPEEHQDVTRILSDLAARLSRREWGSFSAWKEIWMLNSAIALFRREVERKTGSPAKPTTTGFREYAMNRLLIAVKAAEIVKSVDTAIPLQCELVGSLGANKGALQLRTEFKFQDGNTTDAAFLPLAQVKKRTQRTFAAHLRAIVDKAYADDLFRELASLNDIEDVEDVKTVYELLLFKKYFALDAKPYAPSSGEASMVMLQKELERDADIYILDEPERSLGNEYISDVIVPLIKERARAGKKVFVSTHDANIAVRTLPYSSVYRCHGPNGYSTYIGNPFSNNLVNSQDVTDKMDWKEVSMRTLEGGEAAFGERGKIYGKA